MFEAIEKRLKNYKLNSEIADFSSFFIDKTGKSLTEINEQFYVVLNHR